MLDMVWVIMLVIEGRSMPPTVVELPGFSYVEYDDMQYCEKEAKKLTFMVNDRSMYYKCFPDQSTNTRRKMYETQ